ncbi:MAG: penicillin-insensitive murein endopeptidase [Deltaproteobacteria bacterium]|nr:penicillin-insensitive murein endopeptidase [Nannocystaceae bacterium]
MPHRLTFIVSALLSLTCAGTAFAADPPPPPDDVRADDAPKASAKAKAASKAAADKASTAKPASRKSVDSDARDDDEHDGDAPERQIPERTRAPASPECDDRVPLWEHVVDKGESLGGIAGRYGVRRAELLRLNPSLKNPDFIRIGAKIRVCPTIAPRLRKEIEVVVKPGATAGAIALEHGLTVAELVGMQRGSLTNPNKITAGKTLRVVVDAGIAPEFLPAEPPRRLSRKAGSSATRTARAPTRSRVGEQLPLAHSAYFVKRPHLAWGTTTTIDRIRGAVDQYRRRHPHGPLVHIGDISKQGGGPLHPHLSHRVGRDVDVGYVLRGEDADRTRFSGVTHDNLDVARTWSLVRAFVDTGGVEVIFLDYGLQKILYEYAKEHGSSEEELDELFQYPRGRGRSHGIIRHWRSHQHHFHVRFRS